MGGYTRIPCDRSHPGRFMSLVGTTRTSRDVRAMSVIEGNPDIQSDSAEGPRLAHLRARELGASSFINSPGGHRQVPSMTCYNRPTGRQPHAHTVRFRRKERVEDAIDVFRNDPNSRVLHVGTRPDLCACAFLCG